MDFKTKYCEKYRISYSNVNGHRPYQLNNVRINYKSHRSIRNRSCKYKWNSLLPPDLSNKYRSDLEQLN